MRHFRETEFIDFKSLSADAYLSLKQKMTDVIREMLDTDKIRMWNAYCESSNSMDDMVSPMSETEGIDNYYEGKTPFEILQDMNGSGFDTNDDWYWFTVHGLCSGSVADLFGDRGPASESDIAEEIMSQGMWCDAIDDYDWPEEALYVGEDDE